jgi:hypothetical protein
LLIKGSIVVVEVSSIVTQIYRNKSSIRGAKAGDRHSYLKIRRVKNLHSKRSVKYKYKCLCAAVGLAYEQSRRPFQEGSIPASPCWDESPVLHITGLA